MGRGSGKSRDEFREKQLRAAIRRNPDVALDQLQKDGQPLTRFRKAASLTAVATGDWHCRRLFQRCAVLAKVTRTPRRRRCGSAILCVRGRRSRGRRRARRGLGSGGAGARSATAIQDLTDGFGADVVIDRSADRRPGGTRSTRVTWPWCWWGCPLRRPGHEERLPIRLTAAP